jgi:hypothetical protein
MTDYTTPENNRRAHTPMGWHVTREVSLGLILAAILQAAALLGAYYKIVSDVELLKADVSTLHLRDNKVEADLRETISLMRDQFVRMESKLDRLIERGRK